MSDLRTAILEYLDPIEPADPWAMEERQYGSEDVDAELQQLERHGQIVVEFDPHGAGECVALAAALEHPEHIRAQASYGHLKEAVFAEVRRRGLRCDWRSGRGWTLWGTDDEVACYGSMHNIARYLGIQTR